MLASSLGPPASASGVAGVYHIGSFSHFQKVGPELGSSAEAEAGVVGDEDSEKHGCILKGPGAHRPQSDSVSGGHRFVGCGHGQCRC